MNLKKKKKSWRRQRTGHTGEQTRAGGLFLAGVTCSLLVPPSSGLHTSTNAAPHPALSRRWSRQAFPWLLPKPEGDPNPAHGRRGSADWRGSSGVDRSGEATRWLKLPAESAENETQRRMKDHPKAGMKPLGPGNDEAPQSGGAAVSDHALLLQRSSGWGSSCLLLAEQRRET